MGEEVKFSFDPAEVFRNTQYFKDHRDFVKSRFADLGYEVTKWGWDKDPESSSWVKHADGIQFNKNDSDLYLSIEVVGVVGKSLRRLVQDEARD